MSDDDTTTTEAPTRRDTIKYGGAVVGGGLLAGCTGNSGSGDGGATGTPSPDDNANSSSTQTGSETAYEVCLPESGCVEFDDPPETYMTNRAASTGMLVALGEHEGFTAIWAKDQIL
jgi:iron complex transport system substrate-binding protein